MRVYLKTPICCHNLIQVRANTWAACCQVYSPELDSQVSSHFPHQVSGTVQHLQASFLAVRFKSLFKELEKLTNAKQKYCKELPNIGVRLMPFPRGNDSINHWHHHLNTVSVTLCRQDLKPLLHSTNGNVTNTPSISLPSVSNFHPWILGTVSVQTGYTLWECWPPVSRPQNPRASDLESPSTCAHFKPPVTVLISK